MGKLLSAALAGTLLFSQAALARNAGEMPGQPIISIRYDKIVQAATPKPASSTCKKTNNACSGTCVGNDAGKTCKTSDLGVSGNCTCQ